MHTINYFAKFREEIYSRWAHIPQYRQHLDHIFNETLNPKTDHLSIQFEIYYTTNYKFDVQYITELLDIKNYI